MEAQWTQREMEALEEASEARKMADLFLKVLELITVSTPSSHGIYAISFPRKQSLRMRWVSFETKPQLDFSHTNASSPEMGRRRRMRRGSLRRSDKKHRWRLKPHEQPHSACNLRSRSNLTVHWVAPSKRYSYKYLLGHRKTTLKNVLLSGLAWRHKARVTKEKSNLWYPWYLCFWISIQAYIPSKNLHT